MDEVRREDRGIYTGSKPVVFANVGSGGWNLDIQLANVVLPFGHGQQAKS